MVMTFQRKFCMMSIGVGQRFLALIAHDGALRELDTYLLGNLKLYGVPVHLRHRPVDTAVCDDAVADLERFEKILQLLLAPLGRQKDDEVEDREDERDRNQLHVWIHA